MLIGRGKQPSFLPEVVRYFADEYKDDVRFGYIDQTRVPFSAWAMKYVGHVFKGQRALPRAAPDGYYLFSNGQANAFHPGKTFDQDTDLAVMGVGALISLFARSSTPLSTSVQVLQRKAAEDVIAVFEKVIDGLPLSTNGSASAEALTVTDPYTVIGVSSMATDAELKSEYRKQIILNHPDRVAHMSKEIQKVAQGRTQTIINAYRSIIEIRRKK